MPHSLDLHLSGDSPDLANLPVRIDRRAAAQLITRYFFPIAHRSLEVWPLTWQIVNGRALTPTRELIELAQSMLDASPIVRGGPGRRSKMNEEFALQN